MIIALVIFILGAFAVLVQAARKAVRGHEDDLGFHEEAKPERGPAEIGA